MHPRWRAGVLRPNRRQSPRGAHRRVADRVPVQGRGPVRPDARRLFSRRFRHQPRDGPKRQCGGLHALCVALHSASSCWLGSRDGEYGGRNSSTPRRGDTAGSRSHGGWLGKSCHPPRPFQWAKARAVRRGPPPPQAAVRTFDGNGKSVAEVDASMVRAIASRSLTIRSVCLSREGSDRISTSSRSGSGQPSGSIERSRTMSQKAWARANPLSPPMRRAAQTMQARQARTSRVAVRLASLFWSSISR